MRFSSLVVAAVATPAVLAGTTGRAGRPSLTFGCGAPDPSAEQLSVTASFAPQAAGIPADPIATISFGSVFGPDSGQYNHACLGFVKATVLFTQLSILSL